MNSELIQLLGNWSYSRRTIVKRALLFPSAFPRKSMALAAGAVEFVVLSGRAVEAVAGFAQRRPLKACFSLVLNRHRLGRIRASGNRHHFHCSNLAHGGADRLSDLPEGVQVF